MFESLIFMVAIKYWYIVIPVIILLIDAAGAPKRRELDKKVNRALHKPY